MIPAGEVPLDKSCGTNATLILLGGRKDSSHGSSVLKDGANYRLEPTYRSGRFSHVTAGIPEDPHWSPSH